MNRVQKEFTVNDIKKMFSENEAVFVISNSKMKSVESQALRKNLKELGSEIKVVKNTLLRIVAKENESFKSLEPFFNNQISLVFVKKDTFKIASIVKESSKDLLEFNAGILGGSVFYKEKFDLIAKIKDEKVLYAQLCGVLIAPIAQLAFVLKEVSQKDVV